MIFLNTGPIFTPEVFILYKKVGGRGPKSVNFDITHFICYVKDLRNYNRELL